MRGGSKCAEADASVASEFQPYSSIDSAYPEDLGKWLDETTARPGRPARALGESLGGYMGARGSLVRPSQRDD